MDTMRDNMTAVPATFTAGDTFDLLLSDSDFSAADGWTLKLALRGGGSVIDITSTASGADHLFHVAADSSAGPPAVVGTDVWKSGRYTAYLYAEHASLGRYSVSSTTLQILADPTALTATADTRSHARKVLDAIEAVIEGRASVDQEEISLDTGGGRRTLKRTPIKDLLELRSIYAAQVRSEEAAATGSTVGRRFLMEI